MVPRIWWRLCMCGWGCWWCWWHFLSVSLGRFFFIECVCVCGRCHRHCKSLLHVETLACVLKLTLIPQNQCQMIGFIHRFRLSINCFFLFGSSQQNDKLTFKLAWCISLRHPNVHIFFFALFQIVLVSCIGVKTKYELFRECLLDKMIKMMKIYSKIRGFERLKKVTKLFNKFKWKLLISLDLLFGMRDFAEQCIKQIKLSCKMLFLILNICVKNNYISMVEWYRFMSHKQSILVSNKTKWQQQKLAISFNIIFVYSLQIQYVKSWCDCSPLQ